ncbi:MAG: putative small lipoprotein YifL [Paracoccaceae bacterium]|jgi:predicted small lipoprotein YifL
MTARAMGRTLLLAALIAASLAAGCGRKGDPSAPSPDAASAQTDVERRQGL